MSIAEELHKTIDALSEEQQQELLETARQFLGEQSTPTAKDNPEYQALLKELLIKRYEEHKTNPQRAVSLDQITERMSQKYGRQFWPLHTDSIGQSE